MATPLPHPLNSPNAEALHFKMNRYGNIDIEESLCNVFRYATQEEIDKWIKGMKDKEAEKIAGSANEEERLAIKHRMLFIGELRLFFKSLLTTTKT